MGASIANTRTGIAKGNTKVEESDGCLRVTLHNTLVLESMPNGNVWLDSGGWNTATTVSRMNQGLHYLKSDFAISRSKGSLIAWNRNTGEKLTFQCKARLFIDGTMKSQDVATV